MYDVPWLFRKATVLGANFEGPFHAHVHCHYRNEALARSPLKRIPNALTRQSTLIVELEAIPFYSR